MNSNNPLAVEPETENDITHQNLFAVSFIIPFNCNGGSIEDSRDLFK